MSKIKLEEEDDEVLIIIKPKKNYKDKIRIFGENFVNNNQDKSKIIYKNKVYELKEYFDDIDKNYKHKDNIIFKLKGINNITDMSYMFADCDNIISLYIISINKNFNKPEEKNGTVSMINPSISLSSEYDPFNVYGGGGFSEDDKSKPSIDLSSVSKSIDSNPDELKDIFPFANSLTILKTDNVINMSYMFSGCSSLISLPFLSQLITSKVTNMSNMFRGCISIESFPDISKWNTYFECY